MASPLSSFNISIPPPTPPLTLSRSSSDDKICKTRILQEPSSPKTQSLDQIYVDLKEIEDRVSGNITRLFVELSNPQNKEEILLHTLQNCANNEKSKSNAGLNPIALQLHSIKQIEKIEDLGTILAILHQISVFTLFSWKKTDSGIELKEGQLNLPSFRYFLPGNDTPENGHKEKRECFLNYIKRIFVVSGTPRIFSEQTAENVLRFEQKLATIHVQLIDPKNGIKNLIEMDLEKLNTIFPDLSFSTYFQTLGLNPDKIFIQNFYYFQDLINLLKEESVPTLIAYLRFSLIHQLAPALSSPYTEAHQELYQKILAGEGWTLQNNPSIEIIRERGWLILGKVYFGYYEGKDLNNHPLFTKSAVKKLLELAENEKNPSQIELYRKVNILGKRILNAIGCCNDTDCFNLDDLELDSTKDFARNILRLNTFIIRKLIEEPLLKS